MSGKMGYVFRSRLQQEKQLAVELSRRKTRVGGGTGGVEIK